jgi:hypothetical protein
MSVRSSELSSAAAAGGPDWVAGIEAQSEHGPQPNGRTFGHDKD